MDFLQNLNEAKLFPGGKYSLHNYTPKDITDLLFLHILAMQILKSEYHGQPLARKYMEKTGNINNQNFWSSAKNELYALLHLVHGEYSTPQRVKLAGNAEQNNDYWKTIKINKHNLIKYLRNVLSGNIDDSFDRRFLISLERELRISNDYYKAIRRLAMNWQQQSYSTRRIVMTRLLQFMRAKARRSELLSALEFVADKNKLEDAMMEPLDGSTPEPKKTVEKPKSKEKKMSLMKNLALGAAGTATGYALTRRKKK